MNETSLRKLCSEAKDLANDHVFNAVLITKIIMNAISVVLLAMCIANQKLFIIIHPNGRVLFALHLLWNLFQSAAYVFVHLYDFIRLASHPDNACDYLIPSTMAYYTRLPVNIAVFGVAYSMVSIAVERIVAAFYYRTYENSVHKRFITIVILAQALLAGSTNELLFPGAPDQNGYSIKTSIITPNNSASVLYMNALHIMCALVSFIMFHAVLIWINVKKKMFEGFNQTTSAVNDNRLSARYQISEINKTLKAQVTMIWAYFLVVIIADVAISIPEISVYRISELYIEFFIILPVYSFLIPVVLYFTAKKLRQQSTEVINIEQQFKASGKSENPTEKYFQWLNKDLM